MSESDDVVILPPRTYDDESALLYAKLYAIRNKMYVERLDDDYSLWLYVTDYTQAVEMRVNAWLMQTGVNPVYSRRSNEDPKYRARSQVFKLVTNAYAQLELFVGQKNAADHLYNVISEAEGKYVALYLSFLLDVAQITGTAADVADRRLHRPGLVHLLLWRVLGYLLETTDAQRVREMYDLPVYLQAIWLGVPKYELVARRLSAAEIDRVYANSWALYDLATDKVLVPYYKNKLGFAAATKMPQSFQYPMHTTLGRLFARVDPHTGGYFSDFRVVHNHPNVFVEERVASRTPAEVTLPPREAPLLSQSQDYDSDGDWAGNYDNPTLSDND